MDLLLWKSSVWSLLPEKEKKLAWFLILFLTTQRSAATTADVWHERWSCGAVQYHDTYNIGAYRFWSDLRNLIVVILLRNKLKGNSYSKELMILILFKDRVQRLNLSQCSRVSADQMHLQSLKVMFLEVICMKIPVRAHKPWFMYTGISKYKSESVRKHWSFHTYMQAKYTKSNTFSERDLCKSMYSNCRPPRRHT